MSRILFFVLILTSFAFSQVEVSTRLLRALQNSNPTDYIKGFIYLRDQVDIVGLDEQMYAEKVSLEERAYTVITKLQQKAEATQGNLLRYLEAKMAERKVFSFQSFWIANMIQIEARAEVFQELMNSVELSQMDLDAELQLDRPKIEQLNVESTESVEPGLKIINADKLWKIGITGQGRLIMGIDTGVDVTHPSLSYKWRGNTVPANQAWFDPAGTTTPTDCDGHGTHTMGTMAGRSPATGDTVGVAIDAQWIAAKTICSSPHTSNSIAAFQWAMNPDGNPSTINDMPDAISNSWYDPDVSNECSGIYKTTLDALEAAGIAVVFSAGNAGPGTSTITKPKNINTDEVNVFCVANIVGSSYLGGSNDPINSGSSRGPSVCGGTGSLLIKPEVSAPGTSVRSSYPGGGYANLTGTSMASPHVAGAIALLKSFAPTLTGRQIKLALYNTAKDLGAVGEDNTYGKGLIDVYAAFLSLGSPDTLPPTTITDLAVVEPTSNSLKLTWAAPADSSPSGVTAYDIRYASAPITDTVLFNAATPVIYPTMPDSAGTPQSLVVKSLQFSTTYYFAIRSRDVWGNWSQISNTVSGTTLGAPVIALSEDSLSHTLQTGQTLVDTIFVLNQSTQPSTLNYNVELLNNTFPSGLKMSVMPVILPQPTEKITDKARASTEEKGGQSIEGQGGPDAYGYKWIDSDAPGGPAFVWNDISTTGTVITNWVASGTGNALDDGYAGPFPIGFNFKYYGQVKNQVWVSTNGAILLSSYTSNFYSNSQIPNAAQPNDLIAPFWDDLDGRTQGTVHYKQDGNKFIIQFTNWQKYSASGSFTFQVVLSGGKIFFYYKTMTGTVTNATVGIENAAGNIGLQVAYNASYIHNNLAVMFAAEPDWLNASNISGTIFNGNSAAVILTYHSEDYLPGLYSMDMKVTSNDPLRPSVIIPIKMQISGVIPVELTSFTAEQISGSVNLTWSTATETNNSGFSVERKDEFSGEWKQLAFIEGKGNSVNKETYSFIDRIIPAGKLYYRLKQVDYDGSFNFSDEILVEVQKPKGFALEQNYPNPFNPSTLISFSIPTNGKARLAVYNSLGEMVSTLFDGQVEAGYYSVPFNASQLVSGTYFYKLSLTTPDKNFEAIKKMLLVR